MVEEDTSGGGDGGGRLCDFCGERRALLHCRADAAALCLACDRHVHGANSVSSKHPRSLLCDACSAAPAAVLRSSRVLCSNCDFDAGSDGRAHQRRPVEPFSGCPAAAELAAALGLGEAADLLKKRKDEDRFVEGLLAADEEGSDSVWGFPPQVVRMDDLIVAGADCSHGFQAMGVPPLPKNRNLACGKQRDEILRQLRELIGSETQVTDFEPEIEPIAEFQPQLLNTTPIFEACELQLNTSGWQEVAEPMNLVPETPQEHPQQTVNFSILIPSIPDGAADTYPGNFIVGEGLSPLTPRRGLELLCPDRSSVISRYKEKRKTRRYDKLIRYESRKARAESRVRIKGRFAKTSQVPNS